MSGAAALPERPASMMIPFAPWEIGLMRLGVALLVFFSLPQRVPFRGTPFPNGVGRFLDLGFLAQPGVWSMLRWALMPALLAYVCGRLTVLALGLMVAVVVGYGALENSQGAISHQRQMLAMVLVAQWVMCLWDVGRDALRGKLRIWKDDTARQRRLAHAARVLIAAAYLTCAITKLDNSHGEWLLRTPNLAPQIIKTHANWYFDTLQPTDTFFATTVPQWMIEHPDLTRVLFAPGLLLELFLFLGLLGRIWSLVLGVNTILLHWGIGVIMMLFFDQHIWLLLIFFVNPAYWLVAWVPQMLGRCRDSVPAATPVARPQRSEC